MNSVPFLCFSQYSSHKHARRILDLDKTLSAFLSYNVPHRSRLSWIMDHIRPVLPSRLVRLLRSNTTAANRIRLSTRGHHVHLQDNMRVQAMIELKPTFLVHRNSPPKRPQISAIVARWTWKPRSKSDSPDRWTFLGSSSSFSFAFRSQSNTTSRTAPALSPDSLPSSALRLGVPPVASSSGKAGSPAGLLAVSSSSLGHPKSQRTWTTPGRLSWSSPLLQYHCASTDRSPAPAGPTPCPAAGRARRGTWSAGQSTDWFRGDESTFDAYAGPLPGAASVGRTGRGSRRHHSSTDCAPRLNAPSSRRDSSRIWRANGSDPGRIQRRGRSNKLVPLAACTGPTAVRPVDWSVRSPSRGQSRKSAVEWGVVRGSVRTWANCSGRCRWLWRSSWLRPNCRTDWERVSHPALSSSWLANNERLRKLRATDWATSSTVAKKMEQST